MQFHQRLPIQGAFLGPDLKIAEDAKVTLPDGGVELVHYVDGKRVVIGHSDLRLEDDGYIYAESEITHPSYINWFKEEPELRPNFSIFMGNDLENGLVPREAAVIPEQFLPPVQKFSVKKFLDKE